MNVISYRFKHRRNCRRPSMSAWIGHEGDVLIGCDDCRGFRVLSPEEAAQLDPGAIHDETRPEQAEPSGPTFGDLFARIVPLRLVCREHHDKPVKPNGKGCTDCATQIAQARARRGRKAKRAERDEVMAS